MSINENTPLSWTDEIAKTLPPLCSYKDIAQITQMNPGSIANLHTAGKAPQGSVLIGRKRLFPRGEVLSWLVAMTEGKAGAA